jgi:hypothetical protein
MAANREQKRRQQAALRRAVQLIRTEHPEVWADTYQRARRWADDEAKPTR